MEKWIAIADYTDGTHIEMEFSYNADGNYILESDEQYGIECWLIDKAKEHGGIEWYSVDYVNEMW